MQSGISRAFSRIARPLSVKRTRTWRSSTGSRVRLRWPNASRRLSIGVSVLDSTPIVALVSRHHLWHLNCGRRLSDHEARRHGRLIPCSISFGHL